MKVLVNRSHSQRIHIRSLKDTQCLKSQDIFHYRSQRNSGLTYFLKVINDMAFIIRVSDEKDLFLLCRFEIISDIFWLTLQVLKLILILNL